MIDPSGVHIGIAGTVFGSDPADSSGEQVVKRLEGPAIGLQMLNKAVNVALAVVVSQEMLKAVPPYTGKHF